MENSLTAIDSINENDPFGFDQLRAAGIEISQTLSGDTWTDYNVHDPGVTILEHLCFALSELAYRTTFPVCDYFADQSETVSYNELNLFDKSTIIKTHPSTEVAIRNMLLKQIAHLEDVVVEFQGEQELQPTMLNFYLSIRPDQSNYVSPKRKKNTIAAVKSLYSANRSLCEHLNQVVVCDNIFYDLVAEIEIDNSYEIARTLADIYYQCSGDLSSAENTTASGIVSIPVSDLYRIISDIANVIKIRTLWVKDQDNNKHLNLTQSNLTENVRIRIPESSSQMSIVIRHGERLLSADFTAFSLSYMELLSGSNQDASSILKQASEAQKVALTDRDLLKYSSIQNWFPQNFGINKSGLPSEKYPVRRAKSLQLKAFMTLFEHILMSKQDAINSIKPLFAPLKHDWLETQSRADFIKQIPQVELVLEDNYQSVIRSKSRKSNYATIQASKIIDYLIALYGEAASSRVLREFNYYHQKAELTQQIYQLKRRFLQNIVQVTGHRGKAMDISAPCWNKNNISGLQLKASLLLDFQFLGIRSLSFGVFRNAIHVTFSKSTETELSPAPFAEYTFDSRVIDKMFSQMPFHNVGAVSTEKLMHYFGNKFVCKDKGVTEDFIKGVINLKNLKIGQLPDINHQQILNNDPQLRVNLVYFDQNDQCYHLLNSFEDDETAILAGNTLRQYFIQASRQCEGMHLVEHSLLEKGVADKKAELGIDSDFFVSQISVILPAWTARGSDKLFQAYAQQVITELAPAHIYVRFIWLDLRQMFRFEQKYKNWLLCMSNNTDKEQHKQGSSVELSMMLHQLQQKMSGDG